MTRLAVTLLAVVVACAIGVVSATHQSRRLFAELEAEQAAERKLATEFSQLQLEQGTWATHARVEQVASRRLGMRTPEPATTVVVTLAEEAH